MEEVQRNRLSLGDVKTMNKLVVVVMGQNCEKFIEMCLESVKDADAIVYCDGGSEDKTIELIARFEFDKEFTTPDDGKVHKGINIIENAYNQDDPTMNGKQRNFYLNWVKDIFPDYWCLVLDADEVVEDLNKIKEFINQDNVVKSDIGVWNVKMRHLYNTLGEEDATVPIHFVPSRLFKISMANNYPEVEHPVLTAINRKIASCPSTTIWHLAFAGSLWEIKKRFDGEYKHLAKSIHTEEKLKTLYFSRFLGLYPTKKVSFLEIPNIILKYFKIDKKTVLEMMKKNNEENIKQINQLIKIIEDENTL
jgi:glycosyltransferase involved in cell wall biosynthesis